MDPAQLQIIDGIRKLLALSASANEHEAALAASRAREMLQKHNLTLGVINDASKQRAEQMATDWLGTRLQPHVTQLAWACELMFDVRCFVRSVYADSEDWTWRHARSKQFVFIGLRANVEAAVCTHAYLCATVSALARQRAKEGAIRGPRDARDYKIGAAQRIRQEIWMHKRRVMDADPEAAALVRVGSDIAQRAFDALHIGKGREYRAGGLRGDAYDLGRADGEKVNPYAARTSRMLGDGR
jgi:hypothetical protein